MRGAHQPLKPRAPWPTRGDGRACAGGAAPARPTTVPAHAHHVSCSSKTSGHRFPSACNTLLPVLYTACPSLLSLRCHSMPPLRRAYRSKAAPALSLPLPDSSPSCSQLWDGCQALWPCLRPLSHAWARPGKHTCLSRCGASAGHRQIAPGGSECGSHPIHVSTPFSQSF